MDVLFKNGFVFITFLKVFQKKDLFVRDDTIIFMEDDLSSHTADSIIDCTGKYLIPGLIDIHMHIESSMTTAQEFSKAVVPFGTTTVVADAHEMANVMGLDGLQKYLQYKTILDIFYGIPSSVPSTSPRLETSGSAIGAEEAVALLANKNVVCLGEVMNFKGLTTEGESTIKDLIQAVRKERPFLPLEGHCPHLEGEDLSLFLAAGIDADHTQQDPVGLYEKLSKGMFIEMQKKSLSKENIAVITENNAFDHVAIVTDDVMPNDLLVDHLFANLRLAVAQGWPLFEALYCSTYTGAKRMHFPDRGILAPGKIADIVVLSDLEKLHIEAVYKKGKRYRREDEPHIPSPFGKEYYHTIHCRAAQMSDAIMRNEQVANGKASYHVIEVQPHGTFTRLLTEELPIENHCVAYAKQGLALALLFERHGKNGGVSKAFVKNAMTGMGAIASSWTHDSHNLLVEGTDPESIIVAQQYIREKQGGYVVVEQGKVIAFCPLEIAGIVSEAPLQELAYNIGRVKEAMEKLGYQNDNPLMSFATLTLPVSPAFKLTDKGILNTKEQTFISLEATL